MRYLHAPASSALALEPHTHNPGQIQLSVLVGLDVAWATSKGGKEMHEEEEGSL